MKKFRFKARKLKHKLLEGIVKDYYYKGYIEINPTAKPIKTENGYKLPVDYNGKIVYVPSK